MRLEIDNILGIERAEVTISEGSIVEVIGLNASGKSSIAAAAQAVLAREVNPLGVPAPQAKAVYVHDGAEYGEASLIEDGMIVTWRPNSGTMLAPNDNPHSTPEAVGLIDYTARAGAKERAERLQKALLPDPSQIMHKVGTVLADYLDSDDLIGVLDMIDERGWDAAASIYEDRARVAKRQWREVTGATWGQKVGADWRPNGWLADLDGMTVQQAEEAVIAARDRLAAFHSVKALSEADARLGRDAAEKVPALRSRLADLDDRLNRLIARRDAIDIQRSQRSVEDREESIVRAERVEVCPECGARVRILNGKLIADDTDMDALQEERGKLTGARMQHEKMLKEWMAANDELQPLQKEHQRLTADLAAAVSTSERFGSGEVVTADHTTALANAEADVESARDTIRLVTAERDASALHDTIMRYAEVARAIGPRGIRSRMIEDGLANVNRRLGVVTKTTGWPTITVDERGSLTWDGRPVQLCSASEQWRVQAAMQIALATMTASKVVVLDAADILDAFERTGLVAILKRVAENAGIGILLCSTYVGEGNGEHPWGVVKVTAGRTG